MVFQTDGSFQRSGRIVVLKDPCIKPVSILMKKKEFYRKNLPHLQIQGQTFFVTWLLTGAFIQNRFSDLQIKFKLIKDQIKNESNNKKKDLNEAGNKYFLEFDEKLNTLKSGKHFMKNPEVARAVADSIHYWDNKRMDLYCYCIMSNHVHAVFMVFEKNEFGSPLFLQDIMQSIKNYSARECNKLLGLKGQFWHHESYDRLIRDREELYRIICYVLDNPIKAGLCRERKDWKWSYINPKYNEFL